MIVIFLYPIKCDKVLNKLFFF